MNDGPVNIDQIKIDPMNNGSKLIGPIGVGIMGGTFDPVHLGHLAVAEEARRQLQLSEVVFIPAGHPYFKEVSRISPPEDRLNMLKLVLKDKPYFKISLIEIERPGPSYAIDTVAQMKSEWGTGHELFFIMGWDSLLFLPRWQKPERLLELCKIVVAPRPGYPKPDIRLLEKELPGITRRTIVLDKPVVDISATEIRARVRQGLPISDMVPAPVEKYIQEKGLYQENPKQKTP
jgi:nicotinate-nucleotide adenylyltransferase